MACTYKYQSQAVASLQKYPRLKTESQRAKRCLLLLPQRMLDSWLPRLSKSLLLTGAPWPLNDSSVLHLLILVAETRIYPAAILPHVSFSLIRGFGPCRYAGWTHIVSKSKSQTSSHPTKRGLVRSLYSVDEASRSNVAVGPVSAVVNSVHTFDKRPKQIGSFRPICIYSCK